MRQSVRRNSFVANNGDAAAEDELGSDNPREGTPERYFVELPSAPLPGGRPAIFSTDPAIRRSGDPKSEMSIRASSRPTTQKAWMCVKRAKAQHGDDLELQLVPFVSQPLRQGVQPQEQETDRHTAMTRNTAITVMRTSVSPGAEMNAGR